MSERAELSDMSAQHQAEAFAAYLAKAGGPATPAFARWCASKHLAPMDRAAVWACFKALGR